MADAQKLADHFKKKAAPSGFQFSFQAPAEAPAAAKTPAKKKQAPAQAASQPVTKKSETLPTVAAVTAQMETVAVSGDDKKKKKKKKKKATAPTPSEVPVAVPLPPATTEFQFLFNFDKPGFSEAELAQLVPEPTKKKPAKAWTKKKKTPVAPPPVEPKDPAGTTTFVTLRKATDNSSEVQKMQLRYGKGKRIQTHPVKKKAPEAPDSTFKFNF
ncbi:hypothetical protein ACHHYP_08821 [Achlya hypogyna]|uniref:Uncharacterized protein n=1 Tax=Achlya hypogyna TaxID=1202772 RepID=A0A1V9YP05_ACHHY|nr:hypothetical protein ACHHYP_08821 [Achlya hypogyna]